MYFDLIANAASSAPNSPAEGIELERIATITFQFFCLWAADILIRTFASLRSGLFKLRDKKRRITRDELVCGFGIFAAMAGFAIPVLMYAGILPTVLPIVPFIIASASFLIAIVSFTLIKID